MRSICGRQLFPSLRAHQRCLDSMKILKEQSAQTTTRAVGMAYRLRLPFSFNRMLSLTKSRSAIYELFTTDIKRNCAISRSVSFIKIRMLKKQKRSQTKNFCHSGNGLKTTSYQFLWGTVKQRKSCLDRTFRQNQPYHMEITL